MYLGYNNKEYDYKLRWDVIRTSAAEKDLGIVIDQSGKSSEQCILATKKLILFLEWLKEIYILKVRMS